MTVFQGISDATKDILEKKKIEKIKFGDTTIEPTEIINENNLTTKTLKQQKSKDFNNKNIKSLKNQNNKSTDRRKASKTQITAYLLDNELEMLEELYFLKRKQKIKTDRSTIIGEAIELLHKKTV